MGMMVAMIFITIMALLARLAGNGFGARWNMAYIPEVVFCAPFGAAFATLFEGIGVPAMLMAGFVGSVISYAGMQSATWYYLRWETHANPNMERGGTLKPVIDWIAGRFCWSLGHRGYAWTAAAVKGFIIGLPVGGLPLAIFWPLAHEIGSHYKGRFETLAVREVLTGIAAAVSILIFIKLTGA